MLNSLWSPSKKWLLFVPVLFLQISLFGQSPGGIPTNNTMWLRSDNGVTTTGNNVTLWQEASGANITGNFTVQPLGGTTNTQTSPNQLSHVIGIEVVHCLIWREEWNLQYPLTLVPIMANEDPDKL